ncbi:MAG: hypothetical protein FJY97_04195 [candidate division Zixibacteria bacterium]|nr:hypothetical protein [candidate division Zixibacteria bacterium]
MKLISYLGNLAELRRWFWLMAVLTATSLLPDGAQASHFRYGTLNWKPTGVPGEVKVNFKVAFRRADPL